MGSTEVPNILFQIDSCFLEGCTVDYSTGGTPSFFEEGSKPQTTTMGLTFKETAIMTKEKINQLLELWKKGIPEEEVSKIDKN